MPPASNNNDIGSFSRLCVLLIDFNLYKRVDVFFNNLVFLCNLVDCVLLQT